MARRQVTIYVNGKEVENSIKNVNKEMQALKRTMRENEIGSEKYEAAVQRYRQLSPIIEDHKRKLGGIESNWKSLTTGATKFLGVAGIAFGANEIIQYGKQLYNTGVQMDTLARKANTVLGDSLGYVEAKAREVAAAMGLTNEEYVAAIANSADLLKPMGFTTEQAAKQSVQIQDLAAALSEWSGGKFDAIETTESLRKALLGEREELERYGVSIKQAEVNNALAAKGLDKLTGNSLKQAEAMVTLQLITDKSADAIKGYADNSDSAIRRQAELEAKIKNISQAIATLLLPVFERLVSIAGDVVDVVGDIVEGIESVVDPAKSLTKEFDDQASKVENLEKNIVPLLDRYDELSAKANPTKKEQGELKDIITKVAEAIPSAVSAFGKYGEALGLNTDAARNFIEVEKLRLKFINQDAIAAIENQIKSLETLRDRQLALRKSGGEAQVSGSGLSGNFKPFTDNELRGFDKQIADITNKVAGANAELARLKGENIVLPNKPDQSGGGGLEIDPDKAAKEQKKVEDAKIAALEEALKQEQLLLENQRINKLISEQQYQQQLYELEKEGIIKRLELYQDFGKQRSSQALDLQNQLDQFKADEDERQASRDDEFLQKLETKGIAQVDIAKSIAELEKQTRDNVLEYTQKQADKEVEHLKENNAEKQKAFEELQATQTQIAVDAFENLGVATADFFAGQKKDQVQFLKDILNTLLSALQKSIIANIAGATAIEASTKPFPANLFTTGIKIAAINVAFAAAKAAINSFGQKKRGGWADVRGNEDGQLYRARLIGQPSTGMLDYPHPVLTSSGILANEIGKEYYVSHSDLRNPRILDHVRAIENITSHRQRAAGGYASTSPTQNVATAGTATDPELKQLLQMNANFLAQLLAKGVLANFGNDEILALKRQTERLERASGGRI